MSGERIWADQGSVQIEVLTGDQVGFIFHHPCGPLTATLEYYRVERVTQPLMEHHGPEHVASIAKMIGPEYAEALRVALEPTAEGGGA